jgi:hypothetical protein
MAALDSIKKALGAGARANKYRISLGAGVVNIDGDLLCKSASFPGVTIGEIEVWNQGRKFLVPGDTSYTNEWSVSFYNTQDHKLRIQFIEWLRKFDNFQENKHSDQPASLMTEMKVTQMNADGEEGQTYTFHNVFPKDIGDIEVADESIDTLQEFSVSLSFSDWVIG